ncbi:hypothetical protein ACIA5G_52905 [Amycolatopsis sp. NPDC051758]|uniref:hypothetical protein n=1 Tax=Amycolatopsis sp. NPDC051758 TaxID=3363935 RepID=UPI003792E7CF
MIRAGLVVIVAGIAGLLAHLVVTVPPGSSGVVTGGSWVAIGIGTLLALAGIADFYDFGFGVFPLAIGIAVIIAQRATHFTEAIHMPQLPLGIVAAVLIGVGVLAVSFSEGVDDAIIRLPFFAAASLLSDIFVDFGPGWDEVLNVTTVSLAAAAAVAVVVVFTEDGLSDSDFAVEHYSSRLLLAAVAGTGLAAVLIAVMASFELAVFADVLLTSAAVVGGYLVVPLLVSLVIYWLTGTQAVEIAPVSVVENAIGAMERRLTGIGALAAGLVAVAALVTLFFWGPPGWLLVVLLVTAVVAAAAAGWGGYRAVTELAPLIRSGVTPGRIAVVLETLRRSDPVFRLLPGAGRP